MSSTKEKKAQESSWASQLQTIIKRRKMSVFMIIGAFLILLIIYNVGNFIFLNQMSKQMETELEKRLTSIVSLSATLVENEFLESFQPTLENEYETLSTIRGNLRTIKMQNELEGLFIIDRNFHTILDSQQDFENYITRTYLIDDSLWIQKAWDGVSTSSTLHSFENQKFKSAYSPVRNISGDIIGVIVAEANVYFFTLLDRYRNTFFITALISGGIFILFTAFLIYALRLLIRTQENLRNTEQLAMMGQMSAVLAHEIRNPLGIIRGTADVLQSRYQKENPPDPLFQYIPDEVNRLNKLVNNFLVLSRNTTINLTKQDLSQLLENTIEKMGLEKNEKSIQFEFQKDDIPPFYFDSNGIQQVIINLIRNSIQAIESDGKISIKAEQKTFKKTTFVKITIADNGLGITKDFHRVFEPFFTTKSTGSGLGMAVSKKIIENHNGTIGIESQENNGTTVIFTLPLIDSIEEKE